MAVVLLDASVVIAFLDATDAHHTAAVEAFRRARLDELVLPASAYGEVLVHPARRGPDAVAVVKTFLAHLGVRVEPVGADVAEGAARLRAVTRDLRLPDALVLATADALGVTVLTCDRSWPRSSRRARVI